jgi:hypothetical protein
MKSYFNIKGTVPQDFLLQVFVSSKNLSIPLGLFQIFSKLCGDIRSSRSTTGVVDTSDKWKKSSMRKGLIMFWDTFRVNI